MRTFVTCCALGLMSACAEQKGPARDWQADPAVLELPAVSMLYAVSDIHGGYSRLVALLKAHRIIPAAPLSPDAVQWSAGTAVLVVAGDLFDSGPDGVGVVDLLRALETRAAAAGGRVVVTMGNHEAEFLADPTNKKAAGADGIDLQLQAQGVRPEDVVRGAEARGQWLRRRPFAARVGRWFFSHAGDTRGRTVAQLSDALRAAVDGRGYGDPELTGATSILESENWSEADKTIGARYAAAVGALHLVFGHNPSALGPKGEIGQAQSGALFRIDCGLSPYINYSEGALLRVEIKDAQDVASALRPDGSAAELWRGSIP